MNQESRNCQNCKNSFIIEPEDFKFYDKIKVPPPTWCPECRMVRRIMFRNERSLFNRACDKCGKNIVAMYPKDYISPVYCNECWFSDSWNPLERGREYDFKTIFFEQVSDLYKSVPKAAVIRFHTNINSEYSNFIADDRNVYLSYSVSEGENIAYCANTDKSRDCLDSFFINNSELCYQNVDSSNNYHGIYLIRSRSCVDSNFLFDCINCQNCFMSSNLRNQRFIFRNKQLSEKEYFERLKEADIGNYQALTQMTKEFEKLIKKSLPKFANLTKVVNCTGDNILNSRNSDNIFHSYNCENTKHAARIFDTKDSMDLYGGVRGELIYEGSSSGVDLSKNKFFAHGGVLENSYYVIWCHNSSSLFACIGLRNKSYCILNKQYTKEEYEKLVPRIIKHMDEMPYIDKKGRVYKYGEFFPPELSPFAYNETIAQEYFPLSKSEALAKGYSWKDPEPRNYQITLKTEDLPDHIKDVKDSILNEIIQCAHWELGRPASKCNEQCTQAYKIIPQELAFLRRMSLPLPRLCPNCRHYQRIKQRNPLKLWHRKCQCAGLTSENKVYSNTADHIHHKKDEPCQNEFETTYAPERPEIVYCEQCYLREVV